MEFASDSLEFGLEASAFRKAWESLNLFLFRFVTAKKNREPSPWSTSSVIKNFLA